MCAIEQQRDALSPRMKIYLSGLTAAVLPMRRNWSKAIGVTTPETFPAARADKVIE
jgi:hypothetical protein